jgi:hypothetical protein
VYVDLALSRLTGTRRRRRTRDDNEDEREEANSVTAGMMGRRRTVTAMGRWRRRPRRRRGGGAGGGVARQPPHIPVRLRVLEDSDSFAGYRCGLSRTLGLVNLEVQGGLEATVAVSLSLE